MQPAIPLNQLETLLRERERCFQDRVVPASGIRMDDTGKIVIQGESHPLQDHVLTLLGPKLGIPAAYLRHCPPELRAINVNHWMERLGDRNLFVRMDGHAVRAVLSARYVPVSNLELVRHATRTIPPETGAFVTLSETRLVCQVLLKEHRQLMAPGDEVLGGITLANSEVGFASLEVAQFLHRLVCSNGLIVRVAGESLRRIHLKNRVSLVNEVFAALSSVVEGLPRSLESMRNAREVALPDPSSTLDALPRRYGLSEDEHSAVRAAWQEEQGDTLYHLINALTGAARNEMLSTESALRLQTLAGDLLPA